MTTSEQDMSARLQPAANHALQRTAPRVTLAAAHRPATCAHPAPAAFPQPARRAPQSLSLGSLGPMTRYLLLLVFAATSALAGRNEAWPADAPYNKYFDPWHASMAAEALAKKGAPDALRTLFLAAYVRLSQPFLGGEDLEGMHLIFDRVLTTLGDARFARALASQPPEVRAAVRAFASWSPALKKSPKTAKLLRDVPTIDWPLDKAGRNDR